MITQKRSGDWGEILAVGIAMVVVGAMNVMTIRTLLIFSKWVLT